MTIAPALVKTGTGAAKPLWNWLKVLWTPIICAKEGCKLMREPLDVEETRQTFAEKFSVAELV
jgi:hypothetical protein